MEIYNTVLLVNYYIGPNFNNSNYIIITNAH
jgi:hypothetical protein